MLNITPLLTGYILTLAFVLGTVLASFFTCMAQRRSWKEGVLWGRSRCDVCRHTLAPADLIPVLSFLLLRGRCRFCGGKIPPGCLWGELALGTVFVLLTLRWDVTPALGLYLLFACGLFYLSVVDIETRTIPDGVLLLLTAAQLLWFIGTGFSGRGLLYLLLDGLALSLPILLLALGLEHVLKREAMGGGDIKLLFVLGLYLGWEKGLVMLLSACMGGILAAAISRKRSQPEIPFGPFLSVGAMLALLYGDGLIAAYLGLFY